MAKKMAKNHLSIKEISKFSDVVKDRSERNLSTLYPIYYHIFKNNRLVASYGTDNEVDFWRVAI